MATKEIKKEIVNGPLGQNGGLSKPKVKPEPSEAESGGNSLTKKGESDKPLSDDVCKPKIKSKSEPKKEAHSSTALACWNFNGEATAGFRKAVTTETFNEVEVPGASKPAKLNQCDLICVQEATIRCTTPDPLHSTTVPSKVRKTVNSYIPIDPDRYGVKTCREAGVDNAIFFNNKRFTLDVGKMDEEFSEAFELTDAHVRTEHRLRNERTTKERLEERMAIALLQDRECYIIVISIHSFRHREPAQNLAHLLFTFLEKLKKTGIDYPVIIAGDFNCDIRNADLLEEYLENYHVSEYELRPLRATLRIEERCIDFIVTSKEFEIPVVTAHDLIVPPTTEAELQQAATPRGEVRSDAAATAAQHVTDEQRRAEQLRLHRNITNHSPLSTTLHFAK